MHHSSCVHKLGVCMESICSQPQFDLLLIAHVAVGHFVSLEARLTAEGIMHSRGSQVSVMLMHSSAASKRVFG